MQAGKPLNQKQYHGIPIELKRVHQGGFMRKQRGFTLIELLIVVAIIGILSAIAIPNLLTAMQRSKQKRSMADLRTIATATEAYATDTNRYPRVTSIEELRALIQPRYIKVMPIVDGWGHTYRYECATPG